MTDDNEPTMVSARVERKLAAILVADVAGYSGLMERDEEGTHERLQQLFRDVVWPGVDAHRGESSRPRGMGSSLNSPAPSKRCAAPSSCSRL